VAGVGNSLAETEEGAEVVPEEGV